MPTSVDNGTQAATLDTEHVLETNTAGKTYLPEVNCSNMVAGDRTVIRVKKKVLTGGALVAIVEDVLIGDDIASGAQTPLWKCFPIDSLYQFDLTLVQTDGTGRSYEWSVSEP